MLGLEQYLFSYFAFELLNSLPYDIAKLIYIINGTKEYSITLFIGHMTGFYKTFNKEVS